MLFGGMGLPTFHMMGLVCQMMQPLVMGKAVVVFAPQDPEPPVVPNPQNVFELSRLTRCNGILTTPSFVEAWSHSPEIVEYLKTLDVLVRLRFHDTICKC